MTPKTGVMMLKIQFCHHINKLQMYIKIEINNRNIKYIYLFIIILFCNITSFFNRINAALVKIRDFFQKHLKTLQTPRF